MAKFTKTNKAIHHDGIVEFTDNQSMGGDYTDPDPLNHIEGFRIRNAAPAELDNDYVIKSQTLTRITEDTSFYVRTGGSNAYTGTAETVGGIDPNTGKTIGPWLHPQYAANQIAYYIIDEGVTLTIDIGDGWFYGWDDSTIDGTDTSLPVLDIQNKNFNNVVFEGNISTSRTFTNISLSGTTYRLTFSSSISDIAITDYATFFKFSFDNASGGTRPLAAHGCHKIVAHNYTSKTIDIQMPSQYGSTQYSSGAVAGTGQIMNTVFVNNGTNHNIRLSNSSSTVKNICAYNLAASITGSIIGMYSQNGSTLILNSCASVRYGEGFRSGTGSLLSYGDIASTNCGVGMMSIHTGSTHGTLYVSWGCGTCARAETNSSLYMHGCKLINSNLLLSGYLGSAVKVVKTTSVYAATYAYSASLVGLSYVSTAEIVSSDGGGGGFSYTGIVVPAWDAYTATGSYINYTVST